jgi:bifunctional DNA-binding transcriptional regulator/antitoxin component of YhaV-PrlF toxin-antitoxin module
MPANVKERRGRPAAAKPAGSSRLSRKNQVTIPVAVLRTANIKPGDLLRVVPAAAGQIELRRWQSRFADVVGTLPGFESDVDVEASRDQWG